MKELFKLKKYLARYKWALAAGFVSLIAVDLLQLLIPQVVRRAVDDLALGAVDPKRLILYGTWCAGIALSIGVGRFFWRYFLIGTARKVEQKLRDEFFSHLCTLDFAYFDNTKTGDLMAHATNDINAVRMALGFGSVILTDIVVLGLASLFLMFSLSLHLALYALIPLPFLSLIVALFGRIIRRRFEAVQKSFSELTETVRENISGIKVVKLFVQEHSENFRFDATSRDYLDKNMKLVWVWGAFFPLITLVASFSQGIALWWGGRLAVSGRISLGDFVAFMAYLGILIWPMIAIGRAIDIFQRGAASQGRLNRILETRPQIKDLPGAVKLGTAKGGLGVKGLTYYHQDQSRPALQDISFELKDRKMLGITGTIGSGKSTLAHLLMRLYDYQQGQIALDGREISDYTVDSLREQFAFVPQDSFLFSDSIEENISFGRWPLPEPGELERVARLAAVHQEILGLPKGYKTVIGERGVTLSGGQKQRLALARALLLDRPLLILDDALSAVDADTERRILDSLRSELEQRTSIVISHRIFAIRDADLILVMDQSRIVEQGRHQELLARQGKYYEMHQLQQLERELEKA
ncbi:ABC transporter ATP-binding protein [candidate division TA06 bacterium]|uniref:ABC transporter ATP-binding protein n=1 Tax=candidate division TA06 bacterium TaxID=2250710 RepID=A0A933IBH4_UNCT6|nr:ABC transporter ATP-binding protein [candidate division TA06 bacterium]